MTKNPLINSLTATTYIVLIVLLINFGSRNFPGPDTAIVPVAMISLFTLSAAVMGYIFLSQPIQLYLDGKKKTALRLFLQTVGIFGVITLILVVLILFRIIS